MFIIRSKIIILAVMVLVFLASCVSAESIADTTAAAPSSGISPVIPTLTPVSPTDTPDSNNPLFIVPGGNAPSIDGSILTGEWESAIQSEMSGGGELLLMHDGGYLYLGVRAKAEPVTSICIDQGERVSILHSSAALGTAIYEQGDAEWEMIQDFEWCCREITDSPQAQENRSEHLEQNDWLASNGRMGTPEDVEFKIYMPEGQLRLAVTSIGAPDYEEIGWWPAEMTDDCRNPQIIRGSIPEQAQFSVEDWMMLKSAAE
jgi:hypothetical protein